MAAIDLSYMWFKNGYGDEDRALGFFWILRAGVRLHSGRFFLFLCEDYK